MRPESKPRVPRLYEMKSMPPRLVVPSWRHVSHGVVMAFLCSGGTWSSAVIALVRVRVRVRVRVWVRGRG